VNHFVTYLAGNGSGGEGPNGGQQGTTSESLILGIDEDFPGSLLEFENLL
jgi:hypothetical protein